MAYLRCPNCGITVFDRNPLVPPRPCPRCTARGSSEVPLERVLQLRGGAAASVVNGVPEEQAAEDAPAER
jgi:hypothetical protein